MNPLTNFAMNVIDEHDWEAHRQFEGVYGNRRVFNRTRFYKYLVDTDGDIEIHTVAVKTRKHGSPAIKEVVRASVDNEFMTVYDLALHGMGGYVVDWSKEGLGKRQPWSYAVGWKDEAYSKSKGMWKLSCRVINPEVIDRSDRFKFCGWSETHEDILDYLKAYNENPKIEFLTKAGVPRFTVLSGFVKQLETDKKFMRFFSQNLTEIRDGYYKSDVIRKAYKLGIALKAADKKIADRREFRGANLPNEVDASKAAAYLKEQEGYQSKYEYCRYLQNCKELGIDLLDTKNSFPNNLIERKQIVQDEINAIERRKKAELQKRMDVDIATMSAKFAELAKIRGMFMVKLPKRDKDFQDEGRKMKHCLGRGTYSAKMARGETLIAFIRHTTKPKTPYVTVEFSPEQKRVLQCYAKNNSKPEKQVLDFIDGQFLKAAARVMGV